MSQNRIEVTSHVSRDFLQNSAYFNTIPKVVWEYVSNSIDAAKEGLPARVVVDISNQEIRISDNGRGMSRDELRNFFQMHGENSLRKRGKIVRGRFGTGKSAAFGLANLLIIDTTQGHFRNVVRLHRKDIENANDGNTFPVTDEIVNEPTDESDGTTVIVREFNIRRPDIDKVISYLERHLSRYRIRAFVSINGHECKFEELPYSDSFEIRPPEQVKQKIGDVCLTIKVSPTPLDEEINGIDILSHGIWHGMTLAGVEKRERANYLFGEIDVPILEDGEFIVPAFDNTRNNTLNIQNHVVAVLYGWLSHELEVIRVKLVDKERERRKSEEVQQLEKEAQKIAAILNDDFEHMEMELELNRQVARRSGEKFVDETVHSSGPLMPGDGDTPTSWQRTGQPHGGGTRGESAGGGDQVRPGPTLKHGNELGAPTSVEHGKRQQRKGVFSIEYKPEDEASKRSRYEPLSKTIIINLDHPQIANSLKIGGGQITNPQFRQISYEVAAVEYALALPYERIERDELYDASDALYDVKDTIDRVMRRLTQVLYD